MATTYSTRVDKHFAGLMLDDSKGKSLSIINRLLIIILLCVGMYFNIIIYLAETLNNLIGKFCSHLEKRN